MSRRLHLRAFSGRTELPGAPLSGHGANPMNAAFLSQIPLATLYADPAGYDPERALRQALGMLCGPETARCLLEDLERFQDIGLGGLNPDERRELRKRYGVLDSVHAAEVAAWLDGTYAPMPEDIAEFGQA